MTPAPHPRRRRMPSLLGAVLAALALLPLSAVLAPPASAAGPAVSGTVRCIGGGYAAGVWIATKSGAGTWTSLQPVVRAGSQGMSEYRATLPNNGPFRLHVGCPTSGRSGWNLTAYSGWTSATRFSVECNDINQAAQRGWDSVIRYGRLVDLSGGRPYGTCS